MASGLDLVPSADDLQSLASSLELALKGCMAQLRALRSSASMDKQSSTYASEERALKVSLTGIVAQLQAVREARRKALLLAVLPGALQLLSTTAVLLLAQASAAARACVTAGCEGRLLLLPHLDAVPSDRACRERFLVQKIALGSVRWLSLPADAMSMLLSQRVSNLNAVESLSLPCGCIDFAALPQLPSLRRLGIDAARISNGGTIARLVASLLGLPRPLALLRISRLEPSLALSLIDAVMAGGLVHRLTFQRCVLPDSAVGCICRALLQGGCSGARLRSVCFEECGLSEHAEQHLLATLEQCDGRCSVTIDGGLARPLVDDALSAAATTRHEEVECPKQFNAPENEKAMPIQEMLAMALLRLQEESKRSEAEQTPQTVVASAALPCAMRTDCAEHGRSPLEDELSLSLATEGSQVRRSRFGFALDDDTS